MVKIDIKDRRILYELDCNSRQSSAQIAKKAKLSKDAVNYRINRMTKDGIIKHYYVVLNTLHLGFLHFNTLFRFRDITDKIRRDFVQFCKKHERIIWCVSCYGSWDFSVSFLAHNLTEYDEFIAEILNSFGNNIHEKSMSMMIDSPTYSREYIIEGKEGKKFIYKVAKKRELDEQEKEILSVLSQNARIPIVELATKIKMKPDIARYRIKKLVEKGVVQGFRASIDAEKLGFSYYKILLTLNNLTLQKERELNEFCRMHPNILQFIKYLGQWEIQIELEVRPEDLYSIIDKLRSRFPDIIKTYDILRLKEEKLNYYPMNFPK